MTEAKENCVMSEETLPLPFDLAAFGDKPSRESLGIVLDISEAQSEADASKEMIDEAKTIWEEGRALEFMLSSCKSKHIGDIFLMESLILSYAATRVVNCEGIHISISGSAGKGKSHVVSVVKKHLPEGVTYSGRLSDRALFYHQRPPKSVIIMDDQELSEDMQEAIKNSTTEWDVPYRYETVKNQSAETLTLPIRAVYWIIKVNLNGDEQILDRQLVFHVDESPEQTERIHKSIKEAYLPPVELSNSKNEKEDKNVIMSRMIWQNIPDGLKVYIPYATDIIFSDNLDLRNANIFLALIQAVAALHATKRKTTCDGGVLASIEDFKEAIRIMNPLLENKGGSQTLKLSAPANTLLEYLLTKDSGTYNYSDLQEGTKFTQKKLTEAINGRGDSKSGGLEACPGIEIINLSERYEPNYTDEVGRVRTRSRKAILWNKETFYKSGLSNGGIVMDETKQKYWLQQERENTPPYFPYFP